MSPSSTFSLQMKNKNLFKFKLFFSLLFLVETAVCSDREFKACKPQNCGNIPNISYPFWIHGLQESYCGYPGFNLTCKNSKPILRMSEDDYIINQIYYENQSFWVANAGVSANALSTPIRNVSLDNTNFFFGPSQRNLILFYNCSIMHSNEYINQTLGCTTNDTTHHSLVLFDQDPRMNYGKLSETCELSVVAPIDSDDRSTNSETILCRNYTDLLRKGFALKWKASTCSECKESGGRCGFNWTAYSFRCFCTDRPHIKHCQDRGLSNTTKVGIGLGAGVSVIFLSLVIFIYFRRRQNKQLTAPSSLISKTISSDQFSKSDLEKGSSYFGVHMFTHTELEEATDNFNPNRELGDGGFGAVYLGNLQDGRVVAVKRLYENNYKRVEQFINEVEILTRLRHQNLVTLYGCTSRRSRELLLVYEFIPNGTVADHLHGDRAKAGPLTLPIRMSIAIETANALAYLHASDVIHRDVKTNNILLDNGFHVKVADFGLSRLFPNDVTHVSTAPQGTPGYVDPEYHQCYQLTNKSDVYSFGVVLIELISSKPAVDIGRHRHEINLANMAINKIQNHSLNELVDPSLGFEENYTVKRKTTLVAELAFQCLQHEREMRPTMNEVLEVLKGIENDEQRVAKPEELDIAGDDVVGLLKHIPPPLSPDSVTDKWTSRSTTPNTST